MAMNGLRLGWANTCAPSRFSSAASGARSSTYSPIATPTRGSSSRGGEDSVREACRMPNGRARRKPGSSSRSALLPKQPESDQVVERFTHVARAVRREPPAQSWPHAVGRARSAPAPAACRRGRPAQRQPRRRLPPSSAGRHSQQDIEETVLLRAVRCGVSHGTVQACRAFERNSQIQTRQDELRNMVARSGRLLVSSAGAQLGPVPGFRDHLQRVTPIRLYERVRDRPVRRRRARRRAASSAVRRAGRHRLEHRVAMRSRLRAGSDVRRRQPRRPQARSPPRRSRRRARRTRVGCREAGRQLVCPRGRAQKRADQWRVPGGPVPTMVLDGVGIGVLAGREQRRVVDESGEQRGG